MFVLFLDAGGVVLCGVENVCQCGDVSKGDCDGHGGGEKVLVCVCLVEHSTCVCCGQLLCSTFIARRGYNEKHEFH